MKTLHINVTTDKIRPDGVVKERISMNTKAELQRLSVGTLHESAEDFTLPDYLPEIRRIVSCTGTVLPESRYIDRGEIVLSGLALATVYYIGDDGTLCSFPLNSEYTAKLSMSGSDTADLSADGMIVRTSLESVTCRATGPRRMSVVSKMRSNVFASHRDELPFELASSDASECSVSDELSLEKRTCAFEYTTVSVAASTGSVSGELREREGTRIISCEGAAAVLSATLDASEVTLKGDVYISCLAVDGDGVYFTTRIKAPFEENFHIKDSTADESKRYAMGRVRCAAVKLQGGDGGVFTWEGEYDAEAIILGDREGSLTDDVYSTSYENHTVMSSAPVVRCLAAADSRLSVNSTKQVTGSAGKEVVFVTAKANGDRAECTADGKLILNGSCSVAAILADDDEIVSEELMIPYRYECDCKKPEGANPTVIWDVAVISAEGRLDPDRLSVSCELAFSILALGSGEKSYVSRSVLCRDEPAGLTKNTLKLYFPEESETKWDIGKRYHCPIKCISQIEGESSVLIGAQ